MSLRQLVPAIAAASVALFALVAAVWARRSESSRPYAVVTAIALIVAVAAASIDAPSRTARRSSVSTAQRQVALEQATRKTGADLSPARAQRKEVASRAQRAQRRPVPTNVRRLAAPSADTELKKATDPESLLVHFPDGMSAAERADAVSDAGGKVERTISELDLVVASVPADERNQIRSNLDEDARVEEVESNLVRRMSLDPNDEHYGFEAQAFTHRLPAAWDVTTGISTTDIAVLDTGIDLDHPDLVGRIGAKRDIVNNDATPADQNGHGTFVAGVAAADSNNALGIAGVAWDARIMPVQVLDADGGGTDGDIASGIVWATENGAEVINLSLGAPGSSQALDNAIDYAIANGVVVVAATGNESSDVASYPAAHPNVVAVGATDLLGDVTAFSNRGPWVDVVAVGWDVLSTITDNTYAVGAGTSFSAPVVSGVAALVLAKNPTFTPAQVLSRLRSSAIDRGPAGIDDYYGWGLVDAYASVGGRKAASPPPPAPLTADGTAATAQQIANGTDDVIWPEGDEDWFHYSTSESGRLTVTVTPLNDDGQGALTFDPEISAWDSDLEFRDTVDQQPSGVPEIHTVDGAAGTYRFRVRSTSSSRSPGTSVEPNAYTVTVAFAAQAVTDAAQDKLWVFGMVPDPGADGVSPTAKPTVTFGRDVTEASAEANVSLRDMKTHAFVTTTRSYDAETRKLTVTPSQSLIAGRPYLLTVGAGLVGDSGTAATSEERFTSRFTVASTQKSDLTSDFDKDGFEDVVIGAPGEDHGSTRKDGGLVHVVYGSASGPTGAGSQTWSQDSAGISGAVEAGDRFGESVATGDLNKDGYDDLVVGAPYEDSKVKDSGLIHVLLGSSNGLTASRSQVWSQDSTGVPGTSEVGDRFGGALAVGDFDSAAGDDVAIGGPGEAIGAEKGAGSVHVLRGKSTGLTTTGAQMWTQSSAGIDFFPEAGDGFGGVLAAGDFEGDTHDDLAIGAPSDNVMNLDEGTVTLMRGSIVGLRPGGLLADIFEPFTPEAGDAYGAAIAIADLGGYAPADGYADLVISVPGEDAHLRANAGRFDLIHSDHAGPFLTMRSFDSIFFDESTPEAGLLFGASISARSLGSRGVLAVGNPFDDVTSITDAGSVYVYPSDGIIGGYYGLRSQIVITQDSPNVADAAEAGDRFGHDVALVDSDGDREADLVVGVPTETLSGLASAGSVHVSRKVATASPAHSMWSQSSSGVGSAAEAGDRFGASVG